MQPDFVSVPETPDSSSPISRRESAWRWLATALEGQPVPPLLLAVGLVDIGLLDALDAHAPETRVLAVEPNPDVWRRTIGQPTVDAWRRSARLLYLSGPSYQGSDQAWRFFPSAPVEFKLVIDPRLSKASEANIQAARTLSRIVFGVRANAEARKKFAPLYLRNVLQNLPDLVRGHDVRSLANAFRGNPAIVIAAGPSLDAALGQLRTMRSRAVLIAADTALRPLLTAGIAPHLAVGVDPGQWNARHFQGLPQCDDTWLVGESALAPTAAAAFRDRTFWFRVGDHEPWPWLSDLGLDVGQLTVWGSVLTAAFQVACLAGCDPVIVVGADLSYTSGRPYCRGTTYEFDWALAASWGSDLATSWQDRVNHPKTRVVPDLRGNPTRSTESMLSFRDWLVARARQSGRRVINATGAGIFFGDGLEQMPLSSALLPEIDIPHPATLARSSPDIAAPVMVAELQRVRARLQDNQCTAKPLAQWVEFSGTGFDGAGLVSALDVAIRGLRNGQHAMTPDASATWARLAASEPTASTLRCLPEALAQFAAGLYDASLPDAIATHVDGAERPAMLRDALALLREICVTVMDAEEVEPVRDFDDAQDVVVSSAYKWAPETQWLILMFEALLGRVWSARVPRARRPKYFGDHQTIRALGGERRPLHKNLAPCERLAEQWLRVVDGLEDTTAGSLRREFERTLVAVDARADSTREARAVALSGTVSPESRGTDTRGAATGPAPLLARPRILTNAGLPRCIVAYPVQDGTVCVIPYATHSVVVGSDGVQREHLRWPHPIVGELPWGDGGAVAWGNGLAPWPDTRVQPAYVMYRRRATDEVTVEELPLRPTIGIQWNDRFYWNCFPTPGASWVGIASWTPGEPARRELPDVTLAGMIPAADELTLYPCRFVAGVGFERQLESHGLRWAPGRIPIPFELGGDGSVGSVATSGTWTARTYPEADLIRFEAGDGRTLAMTCHYPLRAAWDDAALIVSCGDRQVFLFDDLRLALEAVAAAAPGSTA